MNSQNLVPVSKALKEALAFSYKLLEKKTLPSPEALLKLGFVKSYRVYGRKFSDDVEVDIRTHNLPNRDGYTYNIRVEDDDIDFSWVVHPNNESTMFAAMLGYLLEKHVFAPTNSERRKTMAKIETALSKIHPAHKSSIVNRAKRIVAAWRKGQKLSLDEQLYKIISARRRYYRAKSTAEAAKWHGEMTKALKGIDFDILRKYWQKFSPLNRYIVEQVTNMTNNTPIRSTSSKKRVVRVLPTWTTEMYQKVQNLKRSGNSSTKGKWSDNVWARDQLVSAMNAYFKVHAPRAPMMPPGQFVNGRQKYLFRGMHASSYFDPDKALRDGYIEERGYIAVTRSRDVADDFASKSERGMVLLIDPFVDIPRGTPWLWFGEETRNSYVESTMWDEHEVLLPPGRLVLYGPAKWSKDNTTVEMRARYAPFAPPTTTTTTSKRARSANSNKQPTKKSSRTSKS